MSLLEDVGTDVGTQNLVIEEPEPKVEMLNSVEARNWSTTWFRMEQRKLRKVLAAKGQK
jgi:hypothetical protein